MKPTAKQQPTVKKQITLQTEDAQRQRKARQAIMAHRLSMDIVYEGFGDAYPITAVGTPQQVAALKVKWGI